MGRPWFVKNPPALIALRDLARKELRGLRVVLDDNRIYLRGTFRVLDPAGRAIDFFSIEVELAHDHPGSVPTVRELAGRIPRILDRHIADETGRACLGVPEEITALWNHSNSLAEFMHGPVNQFFLGQVHYEVNGTFPFGERSHGDAGIAEYYCEQLGVSNFRSIVGAIDIACGSEMLIDQGCYCGSKRALAVCHLWNILFLRSRVPRSRLSHSRKTISRYAFTDLRLPRAPSGLLTARRVPVSKSLADMSGNPRGTNRHRRPTAGRHWRRVR